MFHLERHMWLQTFHFKLALALTQWLHEKKCMYHEKHPQQSQTSKIPLHSWTFYKHVLAQTKQVPLRTFTTDWQDLTPLTSKTQFPEICKTSLRYFWVASNRRRKPNPIGRIQRPFPYRPRHFVHHNSRKLAPQESHHSKTIHLKKVLHTLPHNYPSTWSHTKKGGRFHRAYKLTSEWHTLHCNKPPKTIQLPQMNLYLWQQINPSQDQPLNVPPATNLPMLCTLFAESPKTTSSSFQKHPHWPRDTPYF